MICTVLLAFILTTSAAHAERWCNGVLTSDNVCIGSELHVPPVIVRCDYDGSNGDPRCVGVGRADSRPVDRPRPKSTTPR